MSTRKAPGIGGKALTAMTKRRMSSFEIIQSRLGPGERLVWWGHPLNGLLMRWNCNGTLAAALFILVLASGSWMTGTPEPILASLLRMFLIVVGLGTLLSWLWHYLVSARSIYALTDRRALILTGAASMSFPLERIEFVDTKGFRSGRGHVLFYRGSPTSPAGPDAFKPEIPKFGFLAVPGCEDLARQLLSLREKCRISNMNALGSSGK